MGFRKVTVSTMILSLIPRHLTNNDCWNHCALANLIYRSISPVSFPISQDVTLGHSTSVR